MRSTAYCMVLMVCTSFACGVQQTELPAPGRGKADGTSTGGVRAGIYELQSASFAGSLTVLSASADRIEFDLTVVSRGGGGNHGEILGGVALPSDGGQLVYWPGNDPGSDCQIFFTELSATAIELSQVGFCTDAGFGAWVDVSGTYEREGVSPAALDSGSLLDG